MEDYNFTLNEGINGPLLAAVIGIEMVAGVITNSFVIILTACHFKTWKQPSNIFLTNMSLSYLFIAIFLMPVAFITCAKGEWIFGDTLNQKMRVCQTVAYIYAYSFAAATFSLVLVSFDWFFFIVKALQYKKYMSVNKAVIIVAASWILVAILISPSFALGNYQFSQSFGLCTPVFNDQPGFAIYGSAFFITLIASIIVTSTWTYCYTRKYLKKRSDRRNYADSVYISQKRKLIGLFGTLIIIHFISYTCLITIVILGPFVRISPHFYAVSFVLTWLMAVLSPLAQSFFRHEIRTLIHSFINKVTCCYLQHNQSK